jgi:hypothetical protein
MAHNVTVLVGIQVIVGIPLRFTMSYQTSQHLSYWTLLYEAWITQHLSYGMVRRGECLPNFYATTSNIISGVP